MADPTPTPDLSAMASGFAQVQSAIGNLLKQMGVAGVAYRTTMQDIGSLTGSLKELSATARQAVAAAAEELSKSYSAAAAMRKLREELDSVAKSSTDAKKRKDAETEAMQKMDDILNRMRKNFDITSMSMTELGQRIKGGTLDMATFSTQLLNTAGYFKYGWLSATLEVAKGAERMDINVRKATVGMMGIGEGRVRGAAGFGDVGGVGLRQYQATSDLREGSAKAMMGMALMGKSADQAASDIMAMTQIFGGQMLKSGEFVSFGAATIATAFAKAANVSEQTSRAATVNLIQRFGMSTQQAAATLMGFDREAHKAGMGTELYTSWVTELSQATRAYSSDIGFAQGVVNKFANELKSGVITVQQFAQMGGALRAADFGKQAGILALAQQFGIKVPGAQPGMSPIAAIGLVGEDKKQTALLGVQVQVAQRLAQEMGHGTKNTLELAGYMRIAAKTQPGLENLQYLSNATLKKLFEGFTDMSKVQKEIEKNAPPDPAAQMDELITHAENISLSTQTLADAIQTTIMANAFRVFTVQMGPKEQETAEFMKQQKAFQQQQQKELTETRRMEKLAASGTPEQKEEAKRFLTDRVKRLQAQRQEQDVREQGLTKAGVPEVEAHRLAALESLGKKGDPMAQRQSKDEIDQAVIRARQRRTDVLGERLPDLMRPEEKKEEKIPAIKMAEGGAGIVTKPTLFLAGEAGPERFDFASMFKAPVAPTPQPQMAEVGAPSPSARSSASAPSSSGGNVQVDVQVGLTGDDKEGLIHRVIDEVEKALRRNSVFGRSG